MSLKAYEDVCLRAELFGQPKPDKEEFLAKNKHLDIVKFEEVEIKCAVETTAMLNDDLKTARGSVKKSNLTVGPTQSRLTSLKNICGNMMANFFTGKFASKGNLSYSSEPSYIGQTNYDKDYVQDNTTNDLDSINLGLGSNDNEMTPQSQNGGKKQDGRQIQDGGADINTALSDLKTMQAQENMSLLKTAATDVGKQMTSQMSKLDTLICHTDRAQNSIQHQNKQMRSGLR